MSPELIAALATVTANAPATVSLINRIANTIYNEVAREDFDEVVKQLRLTNAVLMQMQSEMHTLENNLREMEKRSAIEEAYPLVEIRPGKWVRQVKDSIPLPDGSNQDTLKPPHYICQRCAEEKGVRIVLQTTPFGLLYCSACQTSY